MTRSAERLRIAVVGGGLSGLSAGFRLMKLSEQTGRRIELKIFEGSSRYGGVFGSERVEDYLIETGADSFITNKPYALDLVKELGLWDQLITTNARYRKSYILHGGKPVVTPMGFNLLAPARLWPFLCSPLLSPVGKLRACCEYILPAGPELDDESLASFVRRRFGREMLERIAQPMVGGIYTSDPEKLSLKATLPRFVEMEQRFGSVIRALRAENRLSKSGGVDQAASGARYSLFMSLRNGMSELLDGLALQIQSKHVLSLNCAVKGLSRRSESSTGWRLEFDKTPSHESTSEDFDGVVMAVPMYRAADLLQHEDAVLSESLKEIEYASTAIVVSGHRLEQFRHPLDAFGLVVPIVENRKILAVSCLSRKFDGRAPEGKVILRTFVGGAMQPDYLARSDEEIVWLVMEELKEIFGMQGGPEFTRVARWNRSMPQYSLGHQGRIAGIEERLRGLRAFALAGNALHGVGLPEVIHQADLAARRLWEEIGS